MTDWHGCYDSGWQGLIVDEAFAHPAKFARGLIERIVMHGLTKGYWRPGELIGDPFGGVGLGGIVCASKGLRWVGVELEPRFVELGKQNFELHRKTWEHFGDPLPVLVQGDSREFARLVVFPPMDGVITSPPYAESIGNENQIDYSKAKGQHDGLKPSVARDALGGSYGQTPGQIGNEKQETYWQAMHQVYTQMHLALKPGGIAGIVVKDYVKNKQRVPLCDDTCKLLESVGFEVFERTRAWLVEEIRQSGLFGEDIVTTKERKSFFRRLAEFKAAADKWWATLSRQEKAASLWQARSEAWENYMERLTELVEPPDELHPPIKPTPRRILSAAQATVYRAADCPPVEIETRIDWEEVIWCKT